MKIKKWKQIFKLSSAMILLYISPLFLIVPLTMIPYLVVELLKKNKIPLPVKDWDESKPPFSGNVPNNEK